MQCNERRGSCWRCGWRGYRNFNNVDVVDEGRRNKINNAASASHNTSSHIDCQDRESLRILHGGSNFDYRYQARGKHKGKCFVLEHTSFNTCLGIVQQTFGFYYFS